MLLGERAPGLLFFGGYWAFPGGAVEETDRGAGDEDDALARAAVRELFEETGLLVVEGGTDEHASLRRGLLSSEPSARNEASARWRTLVVSGCARPTPIGRLTTPAFAPRRHRTLFLHLEAPRDDALEPCGSELVALRWMRPTDAVAQWRRGELALAPPVLFLLELLERGDLDRFHSDAGAAMAAVEAGRLHSSRFSPGVFTAPLRTPTLPPATTTSCYLVGEQRVFVVDPATYEDSERARLFDVLDEWRASGREIAGVLVTHHHHDHVGSVAAVERRYSVPVFAHRLTLERLPEAPRDARVLEDGDVLELGRAPDGTPDGHLRALHTPGHDRGHVAVVDERYGAAIVGDMLSTVSTIVIDPPEGHLATYLKSLQRLEREALSTLYPSHGPPRRNGRELVRAYLEHRASREHALHDALTLAPSTPRELVPVVYADTDPALHGLAERSLVANLEKLAEEGRARTRADGRWEAVS